MLGWLLLLAAVHAPLPRPAATPNVQDVPGAGPYFALTFDAHEEANGVERMLALLRERGVHATIFVTGRFAKTHPELVREAARDGHEIGNHTFTHPHLTTWNWNHRHDLRPGVTREMFQDQLRSTAVAIEAAIGRQPSPFWRAPYGEQNATIRGWAAELGLIHVDWTRAPGASLDALDWIEDPHAHGFMGAEAMARRLLEFEGRHGVPLAGSIILMHLGSARPDMPLLEALPIVLDETDLRGLKPVPVGVLLAHAGITPPLASAPAGGH
jgi:peptidoglycan/xylan/chitin deacetylase (PgdA/CDA1 family)